MATSFIALSSTPTGEVFWFFFSKKNSLSFLGEMRGEARKGFFFEKKKQKTFVYSVELGT
jgi:hypothetical protein